METRKFSPCLEDIERRKTITPYGAAAEYVTEEPMVMEFTLYAPQQLIHEIPEESVSAKPEAVYRPPALYEATISQPVEFTLRISNIPPHITNQDLYGILFKHCGNTFKRCSLLYLKEGDRGYEKEVRKSRGVAFVGCNSREQANEFAKGARGIIIDNFKMCVETLFDK